MLRKAFSRRPRQSGNLCAPASRRESFLSRLRTLFCAALLLSSALSALAASSTVRVAVFGPEAPEVAARLTAEISKIDGIEVVERGQIEMLLGEQSLGTSGRERLALGRLLSAELLLLVGPKGDSFAYVDAHTGEELFRIREESLEALARSAFLLVEELRDAEKAEAVSVAVLDDKKTRETADVLRVWLQGQGVRVLDRTLSHEVLEERTLIEQGLREKSAPLPAFPGADVLLKVLSAEGRFHLEALSDTGALLGASPPGRATLDQPDPWDVAPGCHDWHLWRRRNLFCTLAETGKSSLGTAPVYDSIRN